LIVGLRVYPAYEVQVLLFCTLATFLKRAAAIHWDLKVPAFLVTHSRSE